VNDKTIGTYFLDDPRPRVVEAPYTFDLPSAARLAAIAPSDLVQLIFFNDPPVRKWGAERMWVRVETINGDQLVGKLTSEPEDMPCLKVGDEVRFDRGFVISVLFSDTKREPVEPPRREYRDRCMVDSCVLDDGVPVAYLYRETNDLARKDDKYPDSGWRIRGDYRNCTQEEFDARESEYVALGAGLNRDDSWLALIDAPVGSAFERNFDTGAYAPVVRSVSS
jgi:hypothetical protein